jgi:lysyl-tRNA synthetase class 2
MHFRVDEEIFQKFPGLTIGVITAQGIDNEKDIDRAASFLQCQVDIIRNEWSLDRLQSDPKIHAWREAYRTFGAKPKKYKCSVENMIRMVIDSAAFSSINKAVDVYNAVSLKHCIPAGGDDLNKVTGDIILTFAKGDERFIPLNGKDAIPPKPEEVIYRDAEDVLCRRWNWRECDKTKMTVASRNLCLVVEGLSPFTEDDVERISTELGREIERFCGGVVNVHLVRSSTPIIEL